MSNSIMKRIGILESLVADLPGVPESGYPFGPVNLVTPDKWLFHDTAAGTDSLLSVEPTGDIFKRGFVPTATSGEYQFVYSEAVSGVDEAWAAWQVPSPSPNLTDYPDWTAGIRVDLEVSTTSVTPIMLSVRVGESPYPPSPTVIDQGTYGQYTVSAADGWVSIASPDSWPYTKYDDTTDLYLYFVNQGYDPELGFVAFGPDDEVFVRSVVVSLMGV